MNFQWASIYHILYREKISFQIVTIVSNSDYWHLTIWDDTIWYVTICEKSHWEFQIPWSTIWVDDYLKTTRLFEKMSSSFQIVTIWICTIWVGLFESMISKSRRLLAAPWLNIQKRVFSVFANLIKRMFFFFCENIRFTKFVKT